MKNGKFMALTRAFSVCLAWLPAIAVTIAAIFTMACAKNDTKSYGEIRLRIAENISALSKAVDSEIPDTNDFILQITGSDGKVIYSGSYGYAPETISVPSGSCDIKIRSVEFDKPKFATPLFGDDQCVIVPAGGVLDVCLTCTQLNSGIRLRTASSFLTAYPHGILYVQSEDGRLMYSYTEKRSAYFMPGSVSVILNDSGNETVLMTRGLAAREMLNVNISVAGYPSESGDGGLGMQLDTLRIWNSEDYVIGGDNNKGNDANNAMSIAEARANIGQKKVWVKGYIVGGDITNSGSNMSFTAPFTKNSHLAIASKASVNTMSSCMSVQLPQGAVRDAINLVDHPELLGKQVCVKGDIVESYFGIVGIKNVSDYVLK